MYLYCLWVFVFLLGIVALIMAASFAETLWRLSRSRWLRRKETLHVVPGECIGPFKLGMSREEILALGILPSEHAGEDKGHHTFPSNGVTVSYDPATGLCNRLSVVFDVGETLRTFTLRGRVLNEMAYREAERFLERVGGRVDHGYGSLAIPGFRATEWDRGDGYIAAIFVEPLTK